MGYNQLWIVAACKDNLEAVRGITSSTLFSQMLFCWNNTHTHTVFFLFVSTLLKFWDTFFLRSLYLLLLRNVCVCKYIIILCIKCHDSSDIPDNMAWDKFFKASKNYCALKFCCFYICVCIRKLTCAGDRLLEERNRMFIFV